MFLRPGNYPELRASANEGACLGTGSQRRAPAQPRATQWQRQLQAREIKPSSVQIKRICFKTTRHGRGGKDANCHGMQLVTMNTLGSGNVLPAFVGPGAVLEAASSAGAVGAGSQRQHWGPARSGVPLGPALAGRWAPLNPLHACCSWAPWQHRLGQGAA